MEINKFIKRNVYVDDLRRIAQIYQASNNGDNMSARLGFGIPLAVAEYDGKIIGFCSLVFIAEDPTIKSFFSTEYEIGENKQILSGFAEKVFKNMTENFRFENSSLLVQANNFNLWMGLNFLQ